MYCSPFIALYELFIGRRRTRDYSDEYSNTDTSPQSDSASSTSALSNLVPLLQQSDSASTSGNSYSVPLPIGEYEVFLNFRGPDTRDNVTDILYRFLTRSKIRTFRDDDELRKGEGIWPNLVKAINQSKISVLIFSPRYAESKWCLRELVEIIEHQKREKGHVILPIFYKVDPKVVRHQTGPYQNAFQQYKRNNFDEKTIQNWKNALNEIGSLKGWHIKAKKEVANVADVVSGVVWSHIIKNNNTLETDELVGIDHHVKQVVDMLDLGAEGVNLVGIYGMGGIGKTTLATSVYNKVSACFDRYSFVEDIRETQEQTNGVLVLQKKLLSNILRMDSVGSEAKKIIRERVTQFKIFVVLDDVDEKFNFEDVLGNLKSFAPGSCFIITSRDMKVLEKLSGDQTKLYEVQEMDDSRSLQLFYKHAFREDRILPGFDDLSKKIVSTTGGLPLALKVIGSLLFRQKKDFWEDKFELLREMPDEDVMNRLMISYTTLNENEQQIFLDIACFHIGEDKEKASYMWSDCKYHPVLHISILVQRSMLKIGDENEFQMHDQLRDMGRAIVRKKDMEHPERRSRIWLEEEANEVLADNKGTDQVRAIRASYGEYTSGSGCFRNMKELRYLHGINMELKDFSRLLPNLKWMHLEYGWYYLGQRVSGASNFNMKNMVIFDVTNCPIGDIPTKEAKKLKFLKVSNCSKMSKLPEFPKTLEMLHFSNFSNKEEDMEVGNLQNLKVLKLQECTLGRINGGTVGMMNGLRELYLTAIKCDFDSFRRVIADIGALSSLEKMEFKNPYLENVLEGIMLPKSLKVLSTSSCFGNLSELLDLEEFTIDNIWETVETEFVISSAAKLKSMKLYFKRSRISMVEGQNAMLPSSLTIVDIDYLQSDRFPNLKNLSNLTQLKLWDCPNLQEIQGLGRLKSLQILVISWMRKLANIEGLGNLMSSSNCKLTDVQIKRCRRLRAFQTFNQHNEDVDDTNDAVQIESLLKLKIIGCPLMDCRSIPKLSKFPRHRELSIYEIGWEMNDESASQLLEGLDNLVELVELRVGRLAGVERLPCLSKLAKLTKLIVYDQLPCLREIVGLGALKLLQELEVGGCILLEKLPVEDLIKLEKLTVSGLPCLPEIVGLGELKSLKELTVSGCISLEKLPVEDLSELEKLKVSGLPCLREIAGFGELKSLKELEVSDLPCLREIVGFGKLKSLKRLQVNGCISLERLSIEGLPYSTMYYIKLDLKGCTNFSNAHFDLSPLTTQGADLRRVKLIINWPEEHLR